METQKIVNLLNSLDNEHLKFSTKKWYVLDSKTKGEYLHLNPIKFLTKPIESSLCYYYDAYILVIGGIAVTGGNANSKVVFKNCAPLQKFLIEINDTLNDEVDLIIIAMPLTVWLNTVTTILILQEAYENLKEIK